WPANSKDPGYSLDGRAAHRQGFYFFRNDRLIQAGGWNGWRNNDAEPHLSLARVCIDLPKTDRHMFGLNAQKNGIVPPADFVDGVNAARAGTTTMAAYVRQADDVYRAGGGRPDNRSVAVPSEGVRAKLRTKLE